MKLLQIKIFSALCKDPWRGGGGTSTCEVYRDMPQIRVYILGLPLYDRVYQAGSQKKARCSTENNMKPKSLIFQIEIIVHLQCFDLDFDP